MADLKLETPPAPANPPVPPSGIPGAASASLRIIATAMIVVCLYYASSVIISLTCAIFIAFVLDSGVKLMERLRVPRALGSLVMVLLSLTLMYLVMYLIYDRAVAFLAELPKFAQHLRQIASHLELTFRHLHINSTTFFPVPEDTRVQAVRLQEESPWMQYLLRGIGSVYGFFVTVMFIPFLVFFMLTAKDQIWTATLNLFPRERRNRAEGVIRGISVMVRQYVIGNFLVALISAAVIAPFFYKINLGYWLVLGLLAAFLSLVPYLGVALALLPPLLVALVQTEPEYKDWRPFALIAIVVVLTHFVALNVLTPKLVGHRVKLNALSVTISMMFWGWLWGGIGLLLAVPITAALKAVCDNIQSLKPYGAWMGEG